MESKGLKAKSIIADSFCRVGTCPLSRRPGLFNYKVSVLRYIQKLKQTDTTYFKYSNLPSSNTKDYSCSLSVGLIKKQNKTKKNKKKKLYTILKYCRFTGGFN